MTNKGVSLIALIITIIVIVILAAVVVNMSINTPESANFANFVTDLSGLQDVVSIRY